MTGRCFVAGYISDEDYAHIISPLERFASGQTARLSRTRPEDTRNPAEAVSHRLPDEHAHTHTR